jgi:saccharopine dehydrogenase-like NADP-dependent oxidoreductase
MNVFCLGGAGKICSEAVRDLVEFSDAERITIGDPNTDAAYRLIDDIDDGRIDYADIDITDKQRAVAQMEGYDVVMDGTTITLNELSTECIALAGCHGVNLNGFGAEYQFDPVFRGNDRIHVPGFGMTPGTTDMMVRFAADQMETVEIVRVSHGAFRPIAFSPSITETTIVEYDPQLEDRVIFEDGEFKQVPPFSRERVIDLPEPYGSHPQWIIPHSETRTVYEYLKDKGIRLIETRGTWPPKNMLLVRALYEWGVLNNDPINVGEAQIGIMDAVSRYLQNSEVGRTTDLYGYALHVEVVGTKEGQETQFILTHTHPPSDGSVAGWEKLRAYTKCVGIPLGIAANLIAEGRSKGTGVVIPERAFDPADIFQELQKRQILIHTAETAIG